MPRFEPDPWSLASEGKLAEAIEVCSRSLAAQSDGPALRRRSAVHLLAGNLAASRDDILAAAALDARKPRRYQGDFDVLRLGVLDWLAGDLSAAAERWTAAVVALQKDEVTYSDGCGGGTAGSLLMFASVRLSSAPLRKLATALLKKLRRRARIGAWPGPVVEFYLGSRTEEALFARVSTEPTLREQNTSQACFAVAVSRLLNGDQEGFVHHMRRAASGPFTEHESFLARHEVNPPGLLLPPG